MKEVSPLYDDCPNFCTVENKKRNAYCDSCEIGENWKAYKSETAEILAKETTKYSFEYLNKCVIDCLRLEKVSPDRWTVTTARLIQILEAERDRRKRLKDWAAKQNAGAGS